MSRRWVIHVRIDGRVVGVRGWRVLDLLTAANMHPLWIGARREWTLDSRRVADVVAVLERAGADVRIAEEAPSKPAEATPEPVEVQLDLFGGDAA